MGESYAGRRDWRASTNSAASSFTPRLAATPLKSSATYLLGSALGPRSISSSSSFKHDVDESLNHFGVTSYVPRSAFFGSAFDAAPNEENKTNEDLELRLTQIQQSAEEYKEEVATLNFHVDALKAELDALQNQHQILKQASSDDLELERESANAQLLKSQLHSERLQQNLSALQTKVVTSFMKKWKLFNKKNVLFRIIKCWRTCSK